MTETPLKQRIRAAYAPLREMGGDSRGMGADRTVWLPPLKSP